MCTGQRVPFHAWETVYDLEQRRGLEEKEEGHSLEAGLYTDRVHTELQSERPQFNSGLQNRTMGS